MFGFLFLVSTYIKNDNFGAIQKKQFTTVRQDGERRYLPTILTESGSPPRPTKSCPRVKGSGFNFARGSESTFEVRLRAGTASYQLPFFMT